MIHAFGKIVGFLLIIYSILLSVQGFQASLFETIPGIIGILIGSNIYYSGKAAKKHTQPHNKQTDHHNHLFKHNSARLRKKEIDPLTQLLKHMSWFLIFFGMLLLLFFISYIFLLFQ